jgi:hypothetical protein
MPNNTYTQKGHYTVVPVADLSSLTAAVNVVGDTRKGGASLGKRAGMVVLADMGSNVFREVVALGATAAAKWQTVDGGTQYTPA